MRPMYCSMLVLILKSFWGVGGSELAVNISAYQFWNMSDMQGYKRVYFNFDISFGILRTLFQTFVQVLMLMDRLHCQFSVKWNNAWMCSWSERSVTFYMVSAQFKITSYLGSNTDFVKEWHFFIFDKEIRVLLKRISGELITVKWAYILGVVSFCQQDNFYSGFGNSS